jgi:hypothetical protein
VVVAVVVAVVGTALPTGSLEGWSL